MESESAESNERQFRNGLLIGRPVTTAALCTCVLLFLAVAEFDRQEPSHPLGGLHRYGAVQRLVSRQIPTVKVVRHANQRTWAVKYTHPITWQRIVHDTETTDRKRADEIAAEQRRKLRDYSVIAGNTDLWGREWWEGEAWRIPVSGFHHGDVIHLLLNLIGLLYLGWLLERRLGHVQYFLFLVTATFVSLLPCFLLEQTVVGISGGLYALFGMLIVMRFSDERLQEQFPVPVIVFGLLWIPIGLLTNAAGITHVSNLGHFAGLLYGLAAGWVFFKPPEWRFAISPRWFLAAHLGIVPAVYFVTHPVWNASYYWYMALNTKNVDDRIRLLKTAIDSDPQLAGAWRRLAAEQYRQGDVAGMWDAMLLGVRFSPTDSAQTEWLGSVWSTVGYADRCIGLDVLPEVFKSQTDVWQRALGMSWPQLDLHWPPMDGDRIATPKPLEAPPVNPDDAHSALLGTTL